MLLTLRLLILSQFLLLTLFFSACNSKQHQTIDEYNTNQTAQTETITPAKQDSAKIIIPGKSIGLTYINENADSVFQILGKPDSSDAAMGKMMASWYENNHETHIFFSRNMGNADERSRVKQIRITSPYFVTANGISVGSNKSEVWKALQNIQPVGSYNSPKTHLQTTVYDDIQNGIAFETDVKNGCVGITVHQPGQQAYEIFNALFPDFRKL